MDQPNPTRLPDTSSTLDTFSPQFCEHCLAVDQAITEIETSIDEPRPSAEWLAKGRKWGKEIDKAVIKIGTFGQICAQADTCRGCKSLQAYVLERIRPVLQQPHEGNIDLFELPVSACLLPRGPAETQPRVLIKFGLDMIEETPAGWNESTIGKDLNAYYSTTATSADSISVEELGPRVNIAEIRGWIKECRATHGARCLGSSVASDWSLVDLDTNGLTFYLIDVHRMCLHPSSYKSPPPYVALSYRWGDPSKSTQCRKANVATLQIPGGLLDRNVTLASSIVDAINLVRELGIRYIWIDALCIVQDDFEGKPTNLSLMGTVYANATFVLAFIEENADEGIAGLGHDRVIQETLHLPTRSLIKSIPRLRNTEVSATKTWYTRGWTYQEGVFAHRILSMDQYAVWRCPTTTRKEGLRQLDPSKGTPQDASSQPPPEDPYLTLPKMPQYPSITLYAQLVQAYNTRNLTKDDDALNAFAGITGRLLSVFPNGFHQGLPEFFFDLALLWQPDPTVPTSSEGDGGGSSGLRRRITTSTPSEPNQPLPSWSWCAWHGALDLSAWDDMHFVFTPEHPNLPVRYNRTVDWQKELIFQKGERVQEWKDIQFTYHKPREIFEDKAGEIENLPLEWKAHRLDDPENKDGGPEEMGTDARGGAKKRCYYTYEPDGQSHHHMEGLKFRFCFPPFERLRNVDRRESRFSNLLRGSVQVAFFALDGLAEKGAVREAWLVDPEEGGDKRVGWIRLNGCTEERISSGAVCELIAISEGVLDVELLDQSRLDFGEVSQARRKERGLYCFVNVLWIDRKEGIAYRVALGRVEREAWKRRCSEENVVLG